MWQIKSALNLIFDILIFPLKNFHPLYSLCLFSLLTAIFLLIVFRYTSDQRGIRETKDKIKAHLLEIRIFKDNLTILLSAQRRLLLYNLIYMKHAVKPLLFMIVPVALIIIQMDAWYGRKPLIPGEASILSLRVTDQEATKLSSNISIEVDKGLTIETPLLRIPETGELSWRVRTNNLGNHQVRVKVAERVFYKEVIVDNGRLWRLSPHSVNSSHWKDLLNPGVEPLEENSLLKEITVHYPNRLIDIFSWKIHWLVLFFVLSTAYAFMLKKFFKVEI